MVRLLPSQGFQLLPTRNLSIESRLPRVHTHKSTFMSVSAEAMLQFDNESQECVMWADVQMKRGFYLDAHRAKGGGQWAYLCPSSCVHTNSHLPTPSHLSGSPLHAS